MAAHSVRSACDVVAGSLGQAIQTWQKDGGEIRGTGPPGRTHRNADEPPYSRRAPGRTCGCWAGKGNGPGRNSKEFDSTACRIRGSPGRSGSPSRNRGQAPRSDRSRSGRLRICEWLHPSQLPAGLSSMRGFGIVGSNVLPRLRAEARERCDVCPRGAGPGARRRSGPAAEEGGPLTQPKVASFGKELAALAAFARDGWCVSAPGPAETAFQLRKRGADCTKSTGHDGTPPPKSTPAQGADPGGQRCTASAGGGRR